MLVIRKVAGLISRPTSLHWKRIVEHGNKLKYISIAWHFFKRFEEKANLRSRRYGKDESKVLEGKII